MTTKFCPKCDADISESFEPDDPSVGIVGGWYCDACDLAVPIGNSDFDFIDEDFAREAAYEISLPSGG